eukprot:jgi/Chlat1/1462/Chrsp12S02011
MAALAAASGAVAPVQGSVRRFRVAGASPAAQPMRVSAAPSSSVRLTTRAAATTEAPISARSEDGVAGIWQAHPDVWNKTYYPKGADHENLKKEWLEFDAEGQVLGRLATRIAMALRGKDSPAYTPSIDMGCYVVVTNAEKVMVTGSKPMQKLYHRHSGRPGGMKVENFLQLQARIPERIIEKAVKGMLPKGALGRDLFRHLKVYKGSEHPHAAQQPKKVTDISFAGRKTAS